MKKLVYVFCLFFGHNKILEFKKDDKNEFITKCTQCERTWIDKKLNKIPKIKYHKVSIKMKGHGQKMIIKNELETLQIKQKVNFYVL